MRCPKCNTEIVLDKEKIEDVIKKSNYGNFARFGYSVARKKSTKETTIRNIREELAQAFIDYMKGGV